MTVYTLHIPVPPSGFLTSFEPETERVALAEEWAETARLSFLAAGGMDWPLADFALVTFRPQRIADTGEYGLHVAESLRPTWHAVSGAFEDLDYHVLRAELAFGKPTWPAEPRMRVEFSEGVRRG